MWCCKIRKLSVCKALTLIGCLYDDAVSGIDIFQLNSLDNVVQPTWVRNIGCLISSYLSDLHNLCAAQLSLHAGKFAKSMGIYIYIYLYTQSTFEPCMARLKSLTWLQVQEASTETL